MEEETEEVDLNIYNDNDWDEWVNLCPQLNLKAGDIFILSTAGPYSGCWNIYRLKEDIFSFGYMRLERYYDNVGWHGEHSWNIRNIGSSIRLLKKDRISNSDYVCRSDCKCHQP